MANLFAIPWRPVMQNNLVVAGAKIYFTLAGTNTASAPFSNSTLTTARTNPVIADGMGKIPTTYLDPAKSYRVRIYSRSATVGVDTPIEEYDPYVPGVFADASALEPVAAAAAASAANAALSASTALAAIAGLDPADLVIITPEMFGAVGDGATNDHAALQAAIDAAVAVGGGNVLLAAKKYLSSTMLTWSGAPVALIGSGSSVQPNVGTTLLFPTGLSGAVNPKNGASGLGSNSSIRNLRIEGSGAVAVSDADAALGVGCGLLVQAAIHVSDVVVQGFEGNGVYLYTGAAGTNANNSVFGRLQVWDNLKNGVATLGSDSNSCTFIKLDASNNGQAGVFENSALGNVYYNPHFSGNGTGATAVPILIGATGGYCRFIDCYKEVHAASTLLFRTTAGGSGQNKINFHAAEGSVATPSTFTVDDVMADTEWGVQGISRNSRFGPAGGTRTSAYTMEETAFIVDGKPIQLMDSPLTANWLLSNTSGRVLFANGGVPFLAVGTTGFGYGGGVGGAVTQITSKSTGVTLNTVSGAITMQGAALAAGAKVSFVVTNSVVAATDVVVPSVKSGGTASAYRAAVTAVAAGSFTITVENITAGSLSEAPIINFAVVKAVAS